MTLLQLPRQMRQEVWSTNNDIQGFPTSTLEPRARSTPSTILPSQKGKHQKVKGRLFERTKVIKIKSISVAEREPLEGSEAFPSCSPSFVLLPIALVGPGRGVKGLFHPGAELGSHQKQ